MSKTTGRRKSKGAVSSAGENRQAVWDEAVSTIAGGFAHDANNCLTGIFSMSDLCLAQVDPQNPLYESLSLMRDSASQASQLLQRLTKLIYDTPGTRTYHDLNEITAETADILRRVLPRSLDLRLELDSEPLPVFIDAVELRQVLICLAMNVADQVQDVPTIVIATRQRAESTEAASTRTTGSVITVEVSRAARQATNVKEAGDSSELDPAKTAKALQRLSLARAFVDGHEGWMEDSTRMAGNASVRLYLPRAELA